MKQTCRMERECDGEDGQHFGKCGLVAKIEEGRASVISDDDGAFFVPVETLEIRKAKECKKKAFRNFAVDDDNTKFALVTSLCVGELEEKPDWEKVRSRLSAYLQPFFLPLWPIAMFRD